MNTVPSVPDGLEQDLTTHSYLVLRWRTGSGEKKEFQHQPQWDPNAAVRIVLRPVIEVEASDSQGARTIVATIPLESVESIDVEDAESRDIYADDPGEDAWTEVFLPVARWVTHPDKGLLRFSAQ